MLLEMFFNFDGNCRQAVEFYAEVFKTPVSNLMTYGDMPTEGGYEVPEADKDRIMYAGLQMGRSVLMFMDFPSALSVVKGNMISPTVSFESKAEVKRVFKALSAGGTVHSEPQQVFFSELYASVTDKFGINWQILYYVRS